MSSSAEPATTVLCYPVKKIVSTEKACQWIPYGSKETGSGSYGKVYKVCCKTDCDYVAKHIVLNVGENQTVGLFKEIIKNEVSIQRMLASKNISLPVYDAWFCNDYTSATIIMRAADVTVKDMIISRCADTNFILKIVARCVAVIGDMNKNGIIHGDCHDENIMYIAREDKYVIIDMGRAHYASQEGFYDEVGYPGDLLYFLRRMYLTLRMCGNIEAASSLEKFSPGGKVNIYDKFESNLHKGWTGSELSDFPDDEDLSHKDAVVDDQLRNLSDDENGDEDEDGDRENVNETDQLRNLSDDEDLYN